MERAPDNHLDVKSMDNEALRAAIEDQKALIARIPSMAPVLSHALNQCGAELQSRLEAQVGAAVCDAQPAPHAEAEAAQEACQSPTAATNFYTTPVRKAAFAEKPATLGQNAKRARVAPTRFADEHNAVFTNDMVLLTKDERAMRVLLDNQRALFEENQKTIRDNFFKLMCPLLRLDEEAAGTYSETSTSCLERVQMKRVCLADDGHRYDFERLKRYIRDNTGKQLLSPVTHQPMSSSIEFTAVDRHPKTNKTLKGKPLVTKVWTPGLPLPLEAQGSVP
jgi:hypothetical protein